MKNECTRSSFVAAVRHWSFHAVWCASPSFLLAYRVGDFRSGPEVAGMLAGIASMILLLAAVTSSRVFGRQESAGVLRHSVRIGSRIRSVISGIGLAGMVLPTPMVLLALPDVLAGMMALMIVQGAGQVVGFDLSIPGRMGFLPAYAATVIEGLIIAGTLVALVAVTLLFVRRTSRRSTSGTEVATET
jgi:hypothetical protein